MRLASHSMGICTWGLSPRNRPHRVGVFAPTWRAVLVRRISWMGPMDEWEVIVPDGMSAHMVGNHGGTGAPLIHW